MMHSDNMRLRWLGAPIVERDGQQIALPAAKAVALLLLLALAAVPPTRDQVITLLWPERAVAVGRKDLRNTLWQLRQTLGANVIVACGDQLSLAMAVWVDIHAFVATGELGLYRGPLATNLVLRAAPEFELWLDRERERWLGCYLEKLTAAITRARAGADWQYLSHLARTGLQQAPYDETLHQALMEALARQGRRDEAMRHYAHLHDLLAHDLAMLPLTTTTALAEHILAGELAPTLPTYPRRHLPSPYDPTVVASQQLSLGWQLARGGAVEAAAQQFMEAAMTLEAAGDWHGVALAHAEMAALALAVASYPAMGAYAEHARDLLDKSVAPMLQRLVQFLVGMSAYIADVGAEAAALHSGKQLLPGLLQSARMEHGYQMLREQGDGLPMRTSQAACAMMASLGMPLLGIEPALTPAQLDKNG